jgi:hypothetical protein
LDLIFTARIELKVKGGATPIKRYFAFEARDINHLLQNTIRVFWGEKVKKS